MRAPEIDNGVMEIETIDEGDDSFHRTPHYNKNPTSRNPWGPHGSTARDDYCNI